ncbi:hypothetical protein HYD27_19605 [Paenibacillus sp. S150]|nr:S24 family peptidase [Paenibacillus sp. S150]MBW4083566.1 hypothetical protein [Paenibacillus sp. S150]
MGKFSYRATDNSMSGDRIYIGDVLIIEETQSYLPNEICAIANQSDISMLEFRRVEETETGHRLKASNIEIKEEIREHVIIVGRVVMAYRTP